MSVDNDNSFSIDSPICLAEVFGKNTELLEETITDLIFEIHQNADYIGSDRTYHALKLSALSMSLHNLLLCHLEATVRAESYLNDIKKVYPNFGSLDIDVKGIEN